MNTLKCFYKNTILENICFYSVRQVDSSVDAFDMDGTAAKVPQKYPYLPNKWGDLCFYNGKCFYLSTSLFLFQRVFALSTHFQMPGKANGISRNRFLSVSIFPCPFVGLLPPMDYMALYSNSSLIIIIIPQHQHCLALALLSISIAQHQHCSALALLSISISRLCCTE